MKITHIFLGLFVSFICALNIILYEASLTDWKYMSGIQANPYLLAVYLSIMRFVLFFILCYILKVNTTLTRTEYIYLILAGIFTGIFRVCTYLSVSDTNSSIYANYSNIDILMFWINDYFSQTIKYDHIFVESSIICSIVLCSFLANNIINPISDNKNNIEGCIFALIATIFGVLGMISFSKTSKSECSNFFRCGILFLSEAVFCALFIPIGLTDKYYNAIVYVLFLANMCLAFLSYSIIDSFGTTFLAVNLALVIIWSYLYVLYYGSVNDVPNSSLSTILLFNLVIVYNVWKKHCNETFIEKNNKMRSTVSSIIKNYQIRKIVKFEDEMPLVEINNTKQNYSTIEEKEQKNIHNV